MHRKHIEAPAPKINNIIIEKVNEFNFLGLTLDTHLNWKKHSEHISNRCARIIGILNRLKQELPLRIKIMLYNTLLVPQINYCLTIWGFQCERINKFQKKAIRIITQSKYNEHTSPLFKTMNLLRFKDMQSLQELKFYYKFIDNKLPAYLQHWQLITNINIHNHKTSRQHEIHIVGIKHSFAKRSLKHNLPIPLNDNPQIVKDKLYTHSLQGFVNYAKYNFINKYQNSCAIVNCYICMRN